MSNFCNLAVPGAPSFPDRNTRDCHFPLQEALLVRCMVLDKFCLFETGFPLPVCVDNTLLCYGGDAVQMKYLAPSKHFGTL